MIVRHQVLRLIFRFWLQSFLLGTLFFCTGNFTPRLLSPPRCIKWYQQYTVVITPWDRPAVHPVGRGAEILSDASCYWYWDKLCKLGVFILDYTGLCSRIALSSLCMSNAWWRLFGEEFGLKYNNLVLLVFLIDTYDAAQSADLWGEVDSQVLSPLSSTTCRTFHLYLRESHPV